MSIRKGMVIVAGLLLLIMAGCAMSRSAPPSETNTEIGGGIGGVLDNGKKDERKTPDNKGLGSNTLPDTSLEQVSVIGADNKNNEQPLLDSKVTSFEILYFEYDSPVLLPETRNAIVRNFKKMKQVRNGSFVLEGHCDERGSAEYNQALGEKRALAVKQYLTTLNLSAERLRHVSFGKEKQAVTGEGEDVWKMNRRVEIKLDKP